MSNEQSWLSAKRCVFSGTAYVEPFEVIEYADGLAKSQKVNLASICRRKC